jgi:hypothetical protein
MPLRRLQTMRGRPSRGYVEWQSLKEKVTYEKVLTERISIRKMDACHDAPKTAQHKNVLRRLCKPCRRDYHGE